MIIKGLFSFLFESRHEMQEEIQEQKFNQLNTVLLRCDYRLKRAH